MDYYELMHKDDLVCMFSLEDEVVLNIALPESGMELLPLGCKDKRSISEWLKARAIPATRIGIDKILTNTFQALLDNYGLSLTDSYWIKPVAIDLTWKDVNFYTNDFQATKILDDLGSIDCRGKTNFTPSATLKGDLKKKWILSDGERVLIKGNYGQTALQAVSEVMATAIYEKQKIADYTSYTFADIQSDDQDILGCACPNFTSENLEFIPAIDIVNSVKKRQDQSYYQLYIELCQEHGLTDIEDFMSAMFSVDFILANVDRHLNNFGILRDTTTLQWIRPAPVFDSGNSLFYRAAPRARLPVGKELLKTEVSSFTKTIVSQLRLVKNARIDLKKLPTDEEYLKILNKDDSLHAFDKEQRILLLHETKQIFEDFLNGAKPWAYQSR